MSENTVAVELSNFDALGWTVERTAEVMRDASNAVDGHAPEPGCTRCDDAIRLWLAVEADHNGTIAAGAAVRFWPEFGASSDSMAYGYGTVERVAVADSWARYSITDNVPHGSGSPRTVTRTVYRDAGIVGDRVERVATLESVAAEPLEQWELELLAPVDREAELRTIAEWLLAERAHIGAEALRQRDSQMEALRARARDAERKAEYFAPMGEANRYACQRGDETSQCSELDRSLRTMGLVDRQGRNGQGEHLADEGWYRDNVDYDVSVAVSITITTEVYVNVSANAAADADSDTIAEEISESTIRDAVYNALPSGYDGNFDVDEWSVSDYSES